MATCFIYTIAVRLSFPQTYFYCRCPPDLCCCHQAWLIASSVVCALRSFLVVPLSTDCVLSYSLERALLTLDITSSSNETASLGLPRLWITWISINLSHSIHLPSFAFASCSYPRSCLVPFICDGMLYQQLVKHTVCDSEELFGWCFESITSSESPIILD